MPVMQPTDEAYQRSGTLTMSEEVLFYDGFIRLGHLRCHRYPAITRIEWIDSNGDADCVKMEEVTHWAPTNAPEDT